MSNWQPISTAPRDGTRILLATTYPKARHKIIVGSWFAKWNEWQSVPGNWPFRPTCWQPLPEGPQ
jgi:hypothetical protein